MLQVMGPHLGDPSFKFSGGTNMIINVVNRVIKNTCIILAKINVFKFSIENKHQNLKVFRPSLRNVTPNNMNCTDFLSD